MIALRVLGAKKLMISVPFFVPASLVMLILKHRTLLEISILEEIKHRTEKEETGGYDAVIVYWSKFIILKVQLIKILKSISSRLMINSK